MNLCTRAAHERRASSLGGVVDPACRRGRPAAERRRRPAARVARARGGRVRGAGRGRRGARRRRVRLLRGRGRRARRRGSSRACDARHAPERGERVTLRPLPRRGAPVRPGDGREARLLSEPVIDTPGRRGRRRSPRAQPRAAGRRVRPPACEPASRQDAQTSVEIARRQLELGAGRAHVPEARRGRDDGRRGFDDVLVPYNLVGARKLERLAALLRRATIRVSLRRRGAPARSRRAARTRGREGAGVLVECDTGLGGPAWPRLPAAELVALARSTGGAALRRVADVPRAARRSAAFLTRGARGCSIPVETSRRRDADDVEGRELAAS